MKAAIRWFVVLILMFLASPIICTADPISIRINWDGGVWGADSGTVMTTAVNLKLYLSDSNSTANSTTSSPSIFNMVLSPANQGQSFTNFSTNPDFVDFVNFLTNGSPRYLNANCLDNVTSADIGTGLWLDGLNGDPYVPPGTEINNMILTVNSFTLTISTNGNGTVNTSHYGDLMLAMNATMDAVPEPRTVLLLAVPVMLLLWRKRKSVF